MNTLKKIMMMVLVIQLANFMLSTQVYGQTKKAEPTVSPSASTSTALAKVEIKKEELPETTKNILAANEFKDWTVSKVYKVKTKVKDASGKEIEEYEVEMTRAEQKQVLMFDKDGNIKTKEG